MQHVIMLEFDTDRLVSRVKHRFGGNAAAVTDCWPSDDVPNRSTVSRWLNGTSLPQSANTLLSLAAALDLDPFTLWRAKPELFARVIARIVTAARSKRWSQLTPALSFVESFVGPTSNWPPDFIERYFERSWSVARFQHNADSRRNFYAGMIIRSLLPTNIDRDQVWHFAWRDMIEGAIWRPYGFVRLAATDLSLYSYSGLINRCIVPSERDSFGVETWFGEGAANFKVVSIHPFDLELSDQMPNGMSVRFGFPDRGI
jgi:hypothetical protein